MKIKRFFLIFCRQSGAGKDWARTNRAAELAVISLSALHRRM